MIKVDITKEDVLSHIEDKLLEAFEDEPYQDSDGEYHGGRNKFYPLLDKIINKVSEELATKLWDEEKKTLSERISTKIEDSMEKIFNTEYQPVNHWGDKEGSPTTIKQLFLAKTKDYWNQRVDANGIPTDNNWGEKQTRAEFVAKTQLTTAFDSAMKENLHLIVKEFKDSLQQSLEQSTKENIEDAIKTLIR